MIGRDMYCLKRKRNGMNHDMPLYKQIIRELENGILTGRFLPGACIPTVRALAEQYHVDPNTAQRAVQEVKCMGLLIPLRGKGTAVTEDTDMIYRLRRKRCEALIAAFYKQMEELGYSKEETVTLLRMEN